MKPACDIRKEEGNVERGMLSVWVRIQQEMEGFYEGRSERHRILT